MESRTRISVENDIGSEKGVGLEKEDREEVAGKG